MSSIDYNTICGSIDYRYNSYHTSNSHFEYTFWITMIVGIIITDFSLVVLIAVYYTRLRLIFKNTAYKVSAANEWFFKISIVILSLIIITIELIALFWGDWDAVQGVWWTCMAYYMIVALYLCYLLRKHFFTMINESVNCALRAERAVPSEFKMTPIPITTKKCGDNEANNNATETTANIQMHGKMNQSDIVNHVPISNTAMVKIRKILLLRNRFTILTCFSLGFTLFALIFDLIRYLFLTSVTSHSHNSYIMGYLYFTTLIFNNFVDILCISLQFSFDNKIYHFIYNCICKHFEKCKMMQYNANVSQMQLNVKI